MAEDSPPEESAPASKKKGISPVAIIGGAVVGLAVIVFVGLFFLPRDWLAHLRDVSIVFLSIGILVSLVLMVFILAVLVWGIERLGRRLDDLLQRGGAVIDQVKGMATTAKGTTDFVGERIASPFIRASAWFSGMGKGLATLIRGKEGQEVHDE
jgi:hypothetical protein